MHNAFKQLVRDQASLAGPCLEVEDAFIAQVEDLLAVGLPSCGQNVCPAGGAWAVTPYCLVALCVLELSHQAVEPLAD